MGLASRQPASNWLSHDDLCNLLELAGWEVVGIEHLQLLPFEVPFAVGARQPTACETAADPPSGRDDGHHRAAAPRPRACRRGELFRDRAGPQRSRQHPARPRADPGARPADRGDFCRGHSNDDTWEVIHREAAAYRGPHLIRMLRQTGRGKWDAVRTGLAAAQGDVLVIQDADLTAPPEDLAKFFDALASGSAEFCERQPPDLSRREGGDAVPEHAREQVFLAGAELRVGPADQGQPVWHQDALALRLTSA